MESHGDTGTVGEKGGAWRTKEGHEGVGWGLGKEGGESGEGERKEIKGKKDEANS